MDRHAAEIPAAAVPHVFVGGNVPLPRAMRVPARPASAEPRRPHADPKEEQRGRDSRQPVLAGPRGRRRRSEAGLRPPAPRGPGATAVAFYFRPWPSFPNCSHGVFLSAVYVRVSATTCRRRSRTSPSSAATTKVPRCTTSARFRPRAAHLTPLQPSRPAPVPCPR